jgi:hypothetical protein
MLQQHLFKLPAAQQLDAAAVVRVLTAAVAADNAAGVRSVCRLPGAQQVSAEAALELLQQAAAQGFELWLAVRGGLPQLAALPAEQLQLSSQQLCCLLQKGVNMEDSRSFASLFKLVVQAADADEAPFSISSKAMHQGMKALGPDAVAALLQGCVKHHHAEGIALLGQLPAAWQLDQQVAEKLLLQCLLPMDRHDNFSWDPHGCPMCADAGPTVRALVQLPAVQRLAADAVTSGLLACIEEWLQPERCQWCIYSVLLSAKHALSRGAVRQLLQALYGTEQWDDSDTVDWRDEIHRFLGGIYW